MRIEFVRGKICLQLMVFLGLLLSCAKFEAEEARCPWLNEATASGYLNAPVTLNIETGPDDQSVCTFTSIQSAKDYTTLRIMVQQLKDESKTIASYQSQCTSAPIALKAIGNEAVSCSADAGSSRGEQVIGRVRDRLFIVTVSSHTARDAGMTRQLLQQKAKNIAEQIAGALF